MNARNSIAAVGSSEAEASLTLRRIVAADWKLILFGAVVAFFLASLLKSGVPEGWIPNFSTPYSYSGDGLFHAWMAQRVAEGWVFDNPRSGYPFGSSFLDFPGSDAGAHLAIKLSASLFGGSWVAGVNLFFLLGFAACFAATYVTARAYGLNRSLSTAAGLLYSFVPFHFLRLEHLFYTWYFVAPLFFYLALVIYRTHDTGRPTGLKSNLGKWLTAAIGMLVLASFGVYYALFGVIVLALAGVMSLVKTGTFHGFRKAVFLSGAVVVGVLINVAPNLIGTYTNGPNAEVAQRSPAESEIYGLKMMQLIMPRYDHRSSRLANGAQAYNQYSPLVNENATSSFGVVGAAGFMLLLLFIALAPARQNTDHRLRLLAATTFVLFMFATIGGLGSLFAIVISPSIRGWNRISIFIACGSILFFFVALQMLLDRKGARIAKYSTALAGVLVVAGLWDQTTPPCRDCNAIQKTSFENDNHFVQSIEKALPAGAAVYQLPYIGFPELPPLHHLVNYQLMTGVLQSNALHWSFGGMKNRPGDLFYRSLSQEPVARQLDVIKQLGFEGIYIDRRGYEDNGAALVQTLTELLGGPPMLQSANQELVFFKLHGAHHPDLAGKSPQQIMEQAGYFADAMGPRYIASLAEGIDFTKRGFPAFISHASGLSLLEPWGRWSDQPNIKFDFAQPLPRKFTLVVVGRAFGANAQKPTQIKIGDREFTAQFTGEVSQVRIEVNLQEANAQRITFIPPAPATPRQLAGAADDRLLALGFVSMRIEQ